MPLWDSITGTVLVPTAVVGAVAPVYNGGSSNVVKSFSRGNAYLVQAWKNGQAANGNLRITSPKMHDQINGLNFRVPFNSVVPEMPWGIAQRIYSQDTLNTQLSGSAVAGDLEPFCLVTYYDSPDASNGNYIGLDEFEKRYTGNLITVNFALVGLAGAGWGAQQALSAAASGDLTKANTWYALLGVSGFTETAVGNTTAFGVMGPDTGNVRNVIPARLHPSAGGAANAQNEELTQWFWNLSKYTGKPAIQCINSANKGATFFDVLCNENADTVTTSFLFAELTGAVS